MTKVYEDVAEWRRARADRVAAGETLGFVPTMGALHAGHVSLVRRSLAENQATLVSIFVNPTQFDNADDLATYPRTLEDDLRLLEREGATFLLLPRGHDLYPDGYRYWVHEDKASRLLEGAHRPGHFDGVLTVVLKLLLLASANRAYFGEKDWQQLALVRGMAEAFFLPTAIVGCPTVREDDGLALSSRNRRLGADQRRLAPRLRQALSASATPDEARQALVAEGFDVDYVEDWDGRRLAAIRLGAVRLIDNVPLETAGPDGRSS
jgi:pantoate--beta-alanine ligase